MKKTTFLPAVLLAASFSFCLPGKAQNLLINPSAENGAPEGNGWTSLKTGSVCDGSGGWRIAGNQAGYAAAVSGTYIFFPGCGGTGDGTQYELYQNVNVSASATAIDAGKYTVSFSGYMSSFNQSPADQTQMIVEYRSASNAVLNSYNTGIVANISGWVKYTDSRIAPANTRTIRVRLIGINKNGNAVDSYFDDLSLTALSTLPVTFQSFGASQEKDKVVLQWKTADETNSKEFVLERSAGNAPFSPVATVAAKGGGVNEYRYEDWSSRVNAGAIAYRLKQVDNDGRYAYSAVVALASANKAGAKMTVSTSGNGTVAVLLNSGKEGKASIELIDYSGRTVTTKIATVRLGDNNIVLENTGHLPKGMYIVKLLVNGEVHSQKFMVQQ